MIEKKDDSRMRIIIRGAFLTILTLFGGLLLGLLVGDLVFRVLPGSSLENINPGHVAIAAIPALLGFLAGGAAWGVAMGRIAGAPDRKRMAWAGMLGFGPITITLAIGLNALEPLLIARLGAGFPIHRLFTLLFVPTAFIIAGISAWSIGMGLEDRSLAWSLFWRVGLAAAGTFLTINLIMEVAGWIVGAPGAAARFTMVTVMSAGNLGAAFVGGGLMGWLLAAHRNSQYSLSPGGYPAVQ